MNYITVSNKKDLVNTILSIDKSLYFSDINIVFEKMKSLHFEPIANHGCQLKFEGNMNGQIINLNFIKDTKNAPDNNYYLLEKSFYRQYTLTKWIHRGNDLPALIRYSFGQKKQKLSHLEYHIGGDFKRTNKKAPVIISEHEETTEFHYNTPDNMEDSDFYIDYILIMNKTNIVADTIIQYGESECTLKMLKEILPETADFTLEDFVNINKKLTKSEKKLIQMANI